MNKYFLAVWGAWEVLPTLFVMLWVTVWEGCELFPGVASSSRLL